MEEIQLHEPIVFSLVMGEGMYALEIIKRDGGWCVVKLLKLVEAWRLHRSQHVCVLAEGREEYVLGALDQLMANAEVLVATRPEPQEQP